MSKSRFVIGSSLRALAHVALSGILEPTAPFVKMGTCAMAAGAANLRGSTISKLSVLIFSSLLRMALKKRPEVVEGMPHSSKLKFEAWDNECVRFLSNLKQLTTSEAENGQTNCVGLPASSPSNLIPNVEPKEFELEGKNGGHNPAKS